MKERGTVRGRFGGFAIGHLTVSLLGFVLIWLGRGALDGISRATAVDTLMDLRTPAAVGLAVLLMLLYVPAGYGTAWARRWPAPDRRTSVKAVLYPGLCAWGFAALGFVLMFGGSFLTGWGAARGLGTGLPQAMAVCGMFLLLSTVLWASPSFFCVLLVFLGALTLDLTDPQDPVLILLGQGLLGLGLLSSAFLPPLLFHLGALAAARRRAGAGVPRKPEGGPPGGRGQNRGRWLFAAGAAAVLVLLATCGTRSHVEAISDALGIDVTAGETLTYTDSHGGFHGDGTTCAVLYFPDDRVLEQLQADPRWSPLPLDETVQALVYGVSWETDRERFHVGPYLTDEEGEPLVPEIQNGYYRLIDRHAGQNEPGDPGILGRASLNFTLGLYDSDADRLYFCEMDT